MQLLSVEHGDKDCRACLHAPGGRHGQQPQVRLASYRLRALGRRIDDGTIFTPDPNMPYIEPPTYYYKVSQVAISAAILRWWTHMLMLLTLHLSALLCMPADIVAQAAGCRYDIASGRTH